ncbi:hypothetical protein D3C71_1278630 [compost metagenome]
MSVSKIRVRNASRLTNNPMSGSTALSVRPATGVPMTISACPLQRPISSANAVCSTIYGVTPHAAASRCTSADSRVPRGVALMPARSELRAGRGLSVERTGPSRTPLSCSRQ